MFENAPWKSDEKKEDEDSLTSILKTTEQRKQLTLLIANCTASLRESIVDTFYVPHTDPGSRTDALKSALGSKDSNNDDKSKASSESGNGKENPNLENASIDTAKAEQKEQQRLAEREKELSEPKMQELKIAALEFFEEWRDAVLKRVGEVTHSSEEAKDQKHEARPQLPPRRESKKLSSELHKQDEAVGAVLRELYPPVDTPLRGLPEEKRGLILHSMLLLLLSLEKYTAHSRVLMLYLVTSLDLSVNRLLEDESKTAQGLLEAAKHMSADEETKKKAEENASSRKWKVGLGTVAGAALIGVTGGLAAPALAAGIGTVMGGLGMATAGTYLGALASSSVLVGGLFGAYGGSVTGQMMENYARDVEDFSFVPVRPFSDPNKSEKEYRRLRVALGISGWLTEKDEVIKPWLVIGKHTESLALRWELEALLNLGHGITAMVKSAAWGYAKTEIIKRTIFSSLTAGLWPLGLLKIGKVVDNPFQIAKTRSEKAGEVLADAIINKAQGERPLTMIGYSLGSRVIYTCLMSLAKRKAFGLIESAVMLGSPIPSTAAEWRQMRSVVSGRLVNVYTTDDPVLAFIYRTSSIQLGVAGLQPIEGVSSVENVDVTELVDSHTKYRYVTGSILKKIGFQDLDLGEVENEERALRVAEAVEERERAENEKKEGAHDAEKEASEMEKKVQKSTRENMMAWATEKMNLGSGKEKGNVKVGQNETKSEK